MHRSDARCAAVVAAGALPPLVELLDAGSAATVEGASGCLLNLAAGSPQRCDDIAVAGAVAPLVSGLPYLFLSCYLAVSLEMTLYWAEELDKRVFTALSGYLVRDSYPLQSTKLKIVELSTSSIS